MLQNPWIYHLCAGRQRIVAITAWPVRAKGLTPPASDLLQASGHAEDRDAQQCGHELLVRLALRLASLLLQGVIVTVRKILYDQQRYSRARSLCCCCATTAWMQADHSKTNALKPGCVLGRTRGQRSSKIQGLQGSAHRGSEEDQGGDAHVEGARHEECPPAASAIARISLVIGRDRRRIEVRVRKRARARQLVAVTVAEDTHLQATKSGWCFARLS